MGVVGTNAEENTATHWLLGAANNKIGFDKGMEDSDGWEEPESAYLAPLLPLNIRLSKVAQTLATTIPLPKNNWIV